MKLSDFHYSLPQNRIAQAPAEPRDSSRMLVLQAQTGMIHHRHFRDLPDVLQPGDVLVRNNTKVIPARIFGHKTTGGNVEILLTKRQRATSEGEVWECLTKPGLKPGQTVILADSGLTATCIDITNYTRQIQFNLAGTALFSALYEIGHTPLPPYIHWQAYDESDLRRLYQTTYAKIQGSAAAPTAGLHFTPELDQALQEPGIAIEEVTLHVGLGTFLRVKVEDITEHHMHREVYELSTSVAERLTAAKAAGRRLIAVGTTSTRVLETCVTADGSFTAGSNETDIYIYPPYRFQAIDGLITNFHEPQSTLLMLVSALVSQPNTNQAFTTFGESRIGQAYLTAIDQQYRFLSFGDGMLIC